MVNKHTKLQIERKKFECHCLTKTQNTFLYKQKDLLT